MTTPALHETVRRFSHGGGCVDDSMFSLATPDADIKERGLVLPRGPSLFDGHNYFPSKIPFS